MKREFLEGLGLDKEKIDAIMSEYGKKISALKEKAARVDELAAELDGVKAELESAKGVIEGQKEAHATFKAGVVKELVRGACPISALAEKELERELLCSEDGMILSTLEQIKAECPDAFAKTKKSSPVFSSVLDGESGEFSTFNFRSVR